MSSANLPAALGGQHLGAAPDQIGSEHGADVKRPRRFLSAAERRKWVLEASEGGMTGPEIARELGVTRSRVSFILKAERARRKEAEERARGRLDLSGDPATTQVMYLELSARTKHPLLARYGPDVTLGDLMREPNLTAVVNNFGPAGAVELAAVMDRLRDLSPIRPGADMAGKNWCQRAMIAARTSNQPRPVRAHASPGSGRARS